MTNVSISQLKSNPSTIVDQANDYPIAIKNRSNITGYILGKQLFEAMVKSLENSIDLQEAKSADLDTAVGFEELATQLSI